MKKSKKFAEAMNDFQIRKSINFHYNRFVEALLSDIYEENEKKITEIIKYLIDIG